MLQVIVWQSDGEIASPLTAQLTVSSVSPPVEAVVSTEAQRSR